MELPIWFFVLIAFAIGAQLFAAFTSKTPEHKYSLRPALLTPAERSFYGVLKSALDDSATIFSKVRVADVLTPSRGLKRNSRQGAFNKISSKHFDFVLCRNNDLTPICAIELNDKSHNSSKRKARDNFLEHACNSASLPLLQITAKRSYSKEELSKQFGPVIAAQSKDQQRTR